MSYSRLNKNTLDANAAAFEPKCFKPSSNLKLESNSFLPTKKGKPSTSASHQKSNAPIRPSNSLIPPRKEYQQILNRYQPLSDINEVPFEEEFLNPQDGLFRYSQPIFNNPDQSSGPVPYRTSLENQRSNSIGLSKHEMLFNSKGEPVMSIYANPQGFYERTERVAPEERPSMSIPVSAGRIQVARNMYNEQNRMPTGVPLNKQNIPVKSSYLRDHDGFYNKQPELYAEFPIRQQDAYVRETPIRTTPSNVHRSHLQGPYRKENYVQVIEDSVQEQRFYSQNQRIPTENKQIFNVHSNNQPFTERGDFFLSQKKPHQMSHDEYQNAEYRNNQFYNQSRQTGNNNFQQPLYHGDDQFELQNKQNTKLPASYQGYYIEDLKHRSQTQSVRNAYPIKEEFSNPNKGTNYQDVQTRSPYVQEFPNPYIQFDSQRRLSNEFQYEPFDFYNQGGQSTPYKTTPSDSHEFNELNFQFDSQCSSVKSNKLNKPNFLIQNTPMHFENRQTAYQYLDPQILTKEKRLPEQPRNRTRNQPEEFTSRNILWETQQRPRSAIRSTVQEKKAINRVFDSPNKGLISKPYNETQNADFIIKSNPAVKTNIKTVPYTNLLLKQNPQTNTKTSSQRFHIQTFEEVNEELAKKVQNIGVKPLSVYAKPFENHNKNQEIIKLRKALKKTANLDPDQRKVIKGVDILQTNLKPIDVNRLINTDGKNLITVEKEKLFLSDNSMINEDSIDNAIFEPSIASEANLRKQVEDLDDIFKKLEKPKFTNNKEQTSKTKTETNFGMNVQSSPFEISQKRNENPFFQIAKYVEDTEPIKEENKDELRKNSIPAYLTKSVEPAMSKSAPRKKDEKKEKLNRIEDSSYKIEEQDGESASNKPKKPKIVQTAKMIKDNRRELVRGDFDKAKGANFSVKFMMQFRDWKVCYEKTLLPQNLIDVLGNLTDYVEDKIKKERIKNKLKKNRSKPREFKENKIDYIKPLVTEEILDNWEKVKLSEAAEHARKYKKQLEQAIKKEGVKTEIKQTLSKLTKDNFPDVLEDIFKLVKDNDEATRKLIDVIFIKATMERGYCVLYSKLIAVLSKRLNEHLSEEIHKANKDNTTETTKTKIEEHPFRHHMIEKVKNVFEKTKKEILKEIWTDDKEDLENRLKQYTIGNVNFISELIQNRFLGKKIFDQCCKALYTQMGTITPQTFENEIETKEILLNLEGLVVAVDKFGTYLNKVVAYQPVKKDIVKEKLAVDELKRYNNSVEKWILTLESLVKENNKFIPGFIRYKVINLREKSKNNWEESLIESSRKVKGLAEAHVEEEDVNKNKVNKLTMLKLGEDELEDAIKKDLKAFQDLFKYNEMKFDYEWQVVSNLIETRSHGLHEIFGSFAGCLVDLLEEEADVIPVVLYITELINFYASDLSKNQMCELVDSIVSSIQGIPFDVNECPLLIEAWSDIVNNFMKSGVFSENDFELFHEQESEKDLEVILTVLRKHFIASSKDFAIYRKKIANFPFVENHQDVLKRVWNDEENFN